METPVPLHNGSGIAKFHGSCADKHLCRAPGRQKSPCRGFNPVRTCEFPACCRARKKHCAAQAEYGRLAAQAYSPSDAMSQARLCLGTMKKVQQARDEFAGAICALKRALAADVSACEGGVVLQIFPAVGDLAA
jgi:hypothetical protein